MKNELKLFMKIVGVRFSDHASTNIYQCVDVLFRLGGGLFGDTYLSEWKNRQVAAKRITVRIHQNQQNMSTSDNDWIISQISNLRLEVILFFFRLPPCGYC